MPPALVVYADAPGPPPSPAPLPSARRGWHWKPLLCGLRRGLGVAGADGAVLKGERCGARGCLPCHRAKLRRFTSAFGAVTQPEGAWAYGMVLTPTAGRVANRADVDAFFKSVRRWARYLQQGGVLLSAWGVSEVVVKGGWTDIPCGCRSETDLPPAPWIQTVRDTRCITCQGEGRLPAVHLHVHVVGWFRPFWYGTTANCPPKGPGGRPWAMAKGRGFYEVCELAGLGVVRCQPLRLGKGDTAAPEVMARYLSKAASRYLSKNNKTLDHQGSLRCAAVAGQVYGAARSRWSWGGAYGVRGGATAGPKLVIRKGEYLPGELEPEKGTLAAFNADPWGELAAAVAVGPRMPSTETIAAALGLELPLGGLDRVELGARVCGRTNVLTQTQVASTPQPGGGVPSGVGGSPSGGGVPSGVGGSPSGGGDPSGVGVAPEGAPPEGAPPEGAPGDDRLQEVEDLRAMLERADDIRCYGPDAQEGAEPDEVGRARICGALHRHLQGEAVEPVVVEVPSLGPCTVWATSEPPTAAVDRVLAGAAGALIVGASDWWIAPCYVGRGASAVQVRHGEELQALHLARLTWWKNKVGAAIRRAELLRWLGSEESIREVDPRPPTYRPPTWVEVVGLSYHPGAAAWLASPLSSEGAARAEKNDGAP